MRISFPTVPLLISIVLLFACALPAGADDDWKQTDGYKSLQKTEVKRLAGLLKTAVKDGSWRQAWYLADRILSIDPDHKKALAAVEGASTDDLLRAEPPKKKFVKKRDNTLRGLGDDVFHFGETLEARGIDPVDYYEINQRAQAYGSKAGPLVAALKGAGYVWLGTFLDREAKDVEAILGTDVMTSATYPPEFDDAYLKYRALWPGTRVARWGDWRVVTDQEWKQGLGTLSLVAEVELWAIDTFGKGKTDGEITDLVVFKDIESYDKIGVDYVRDQDEKRFLEGSAWYSSWRRRSMVSAAERDNAWIPADALIQGAVGRALARNRLSGSAGGWVRGRGVWLLEGIRGLFEGLRRTDEGSYTFDPKMCWRLAAARALRDSGQLMPWSEFYDLDWNRMQEMDRIGTIKVEVNGKTHDASNVDVAAAQATAVCAGVFLSDPKKGPKHLAKLLAELFKRDLLPDCDKTLRWKKGRTADEAMLAMDAR